MRVLKISPEELEEYLNKKSGLLGVFGDNDMRNALAAQARGDNKAELALAIYYRRIAGDVGRIIAGMGGCDQIVFTGTIGERGYETRIEVMKAFEYMGFRLDVNKNNLELDHGHLNVAAEGSQDILVVKTGEMEMMVLRAAGLFK